MPFGDLGTFEYWNAATNRPPLRSGVGGNGKAYVVNVAGTTSLDGNSTWNLNDLAVFMLDTWIKIPSSGRFATPQAVSDAGPAWPTFRTHYDALTINIGGFPDNGWPGGNNYGTVSPITGALDVPSSADGNMSGPNPGIIIPSGIMGLARTSSNNTPAVGVFGLALSNREQGRLWGGNLVINNFNQAASTPAHGFNGQFNGLELDATLRSPLAGFAGSNFNMFWAALDLDATIDGECSFLHCGIVGGLHAAKTVIHSEHGAALDFAQLGKSVTSGASGSQRLFFITNDGSADRFGYISADPGGDIVVQPNFFGTTASLVVANSDLTQAVNINPVTGISTPSLSVGGNTVLQPPASVTPVNLGNLVIQGTSNTQLTFKYKGLDGVVRSASLTLT